MMMSVAYRGANRRSWEGFPEAPLISSLWKRRSVTDLSGCIDGSFVGVAQYPEFTYYGNRITKGHF